MSVLAAGTAEARQALATLYGELQRHGCAAPSTSGGQLIRPVLSLAGARGCGVTQDSAFWAAAAAVQLAHEASLLHDDVIDNAATRRGAATLNASRGVAAALVQGDHLLTTSYRLAASTGSLDFARTFAHAVERTVAGEKLQAEVRSVSMDERMYRRIVAGKSGELLGCALAAGALVRNDARAQQLYELGQSVGVLYQMLDDFLDYCTAADTGKQPLADFMQKHWTWPLLELDDWTFDDDAQAVAARLAGVDGVGTSPLRRCLARLEREADRLRAAVTLQLPADELLHELIGDWVTRAAAALSATETAAVRAALDAQLARAADRRVFFAGNSRSFSFAARLFPAGFRMRTERVYAFCRITDDIADADDGAGVATKLARLDLWLELARAAHEGRHTGVSLLDEVMRDASAAGVPFAYVEELVEGMRMDLLGERYNDMAALRVYTYRVAGVIGQWLTRLAGVHDEWVLQRAASLGDALQLTNILRDVGEDLQRGRIYLPADLMAAYAIDEAALRAVAAGAPPGCGYERLVEAMIGEADKLYADAFKALPMLPPWFRRPVIVAAHVYRGIHDEIRAAGYDNLRRRATTSTLRKVGLGARALARVPHAGRGAGARRAILAALLFMAMAAMAARLNAQSPAVLQRHAAATAAVIDVPADPARHLDLLRSTFFVAVDRERAVAEGLGSIASLHTAFPEFADRHVAVLLAYQGALTALRAKHGVNPIARLRDGRAGIAMLDRAVAAAPAHAEVRYLRLINLYYLPRLFGRRDDVSRDLAALGHLLRGQPDVPHEMRRLMTEFVLAHGSLPPGEASALRALLESS